MVLPWINRGIKVLSLLLRHLLSLDNVAPRQRSQLQTLPVFLDEQLPLANVFLKFKRMEMPLLPKRCKKADYRQIPTLPDRVTEKRWAVSNQAHIFQKWNHRLRIQINHPSPTGELQQNWLNPTHRFPSLYQSIYLVLIVVFVRNIIRVGKLK